MGLGSEEGSEEGGLQGHCMQMQVWGHPECHPLSHFPPPSPFAHFSAITGGPRGAWSISNNPLSHIPPALLSEDFSEPVAKLPQRRNRAGPGGSEYLTVETSDMVCRDSTHRRRHAGMQLIHPPTVETSLGCPAHTHLKSLSHPVICVRAAHLPLAPPTHTPTHLPTQRPPGHPPPPPPPTHTHPAAQSPSQAPTQPPNHPLNRPPIPIMLIE